MTRCYLCMDIGSESTKPCPNDPPCKPQDICGFQVTECWHKERAKAEELADEQWRHRYREEVGMERLGPEASWEDWEFMDEAEQAQLLGDTERIYKRGFVDGYEEGKNR